MIVVACDIPSLSVLDRSVIDAAYFRDSYRAPASRADASVVDIFIALFCHRPLWMKIVLIVRNRLASLFGLSAPTAAETLHPAFRNRYSVGNKNGVWPIFSVSENELVAGRDNKHLDFRLSVLKIKDGGTVSVAVSTICTVHNLSGKIYLFFIVPFHKWGVQRLMSNAILAGRL